MQETTKIPLEQTKQELESFLTEYKFKVNPDLTDEQRYELLPLLYNYKDVFARNLQEMKRFPHYEHKIDLIANKRLFKRQYRLKPDDAAECERQIKEMLKIDVIEPVSTSR